MAQFYLVLNGKPNVELSKELVQVALERIEKEAEISMGFSFKEKLDEKITRYLWVDKDKKLTVTLVVDFLHNICYLILQSTTEDYLKKIAQLIEEYIEFTPLSKLRNDALENMETDPNSLVRLAYGASTGYSKEDYEIILKGFTSSNDQMVYTAIFAAGLLQWPQLLNDLEGLNKKVVNKDTQELLQRAIAACKQR